MSHINLNFAPLLEGKIQEMLMELVYINFNDIKIHLKPLYVIT